MYNESFTKVHILHEDIYVLVHVERKKREWVRMTSYARVEAQLEKYIYVGACVC